MAMRELVKAFKSIGDGLLTIGRIIGARRFLFVWSAFCVATALFFGISESINLYNSNFVTNMNIFVFTRFLEIVFLFIRLFVPMFILIIAIKYIFDKTDGHASETFKLSSIISLVIGLAIAALYYFDMTHVIGSNNNTFCAVGEACKFNWSIVWVAAKAFLGYSVASLVTLLGLRGVYNELTFMLSKKK
jgi:hypothetical protein